MIEFIDMQYFDTHAHLNFKDYDKDRKKVIKNSLEGGVFTVNVGTDLRESRKVISIAESYKEGVYSAIGLHPLHIKEEDFEESFSEYEKLAKNSKVVAIGETGLDRHGEDLEKQEKVLRKHIELSKKTSLPLILHCRKAHKELIKILKEEEGLKGVVHCFTGGKKEAEEYMGMGFYLGINGVIFKMNMEDTLREVPLERVLLETDCPFLTPPTEKGRNEPLFVKYVAEEVARIKEIEVKEVVKATTENGKKLFGI